MAKKTEETNDIIVSEIRMTEMRFNLVGLSPLVPHAVSFKAQTQLLFPSPKKNAAAKATSMKHEPFEEFRDAAYQFSDDDDTPTRLYMPADAIHGAMAAVAIDMVGAAKAQIGRLTNVPGEKLAVFGVPQIWRAVVKSSDMKKTPDIRTLPILKRWAIPDVRVRFVASLIKETSIANLLANAGLIIGIGDGRPQNGKKTHGCWRLAADDDPELKAIMRDGGRRAQDGGLLNPSFYDLETERLLRWFLDEKNRRSAAPAQDPKPRRRKGGDAVSPVNVPELVAAEHAKVLGRRRNGKSARTS